MQALRPLRTTTTRQIGLRSPRTLSVPPLKRAYAQDNRPVEPANNSRLPLIVGVGLVGTIFAYYFVQTRTGGATSGAKAANSGQSEIKESRRQGGASTEYRDPRDSAVKTSEQDRIRQEAVGKK